MPPLRQGHQFEQMTTDGCETGGRSDGGTLIVAGLPSLDPGVARASVAYDVR